MQDALGVDAFSCSSEALVAEALLDAYKSGDEAAIRQVIASKPIFQDLDNQASTWLQSQPSAWAVMQFLLQNPKVSHTPPPLPINALQQSRPQWVLLFHAYFIVDLAQDGLGL